MTAELGNLAIQNPTFAGTTLLEHGSHVFLICVGTPASPSSYCLVIQLFPMKVVLTALRR